MMSYSPHNNWHVRDEWEVICAPADKREGRPYVSTGAKAR
jgi:hypothetical protein